MFDINDMILFAEIVKRGSFTEAARTLGMPKSSASRRIARLEQTTNTRLLTRTTRQLQLTEAGEVYYQHCINILHEANLAYTSLENLSSSPCGRLRITAPQSIANHLVAPLIAEFLQLYSEIDVSLICENNYLDVVDKGIDLALRMIDSIPDSNLIYRPVYTYKQGFYCSPGYLNNKPKLLSLDDLRLHRYLLMSVTGLREPRTMLSEEGEVEINPQEVSLFSSFDALKQTICHGGGVGILPSYLIGDDLANGKLVQVLPKWENTGTLYAVFPQQQNIPLKLRTFLDFIYERFKHLGQG